MNIPYLTAEDLDALNLSTAEMIGGIEKVIRGGAEGTVWAAPKAVITPGTDQRYMMAALAAMDGPSVLAVKTVVLNPANTDRNLPLINGLVTMLDSDTGRPLAILDGNWITAVRTAILSAVAAKYMALPGSTSVGFVGCGVQAQSHLAAFAEMFPLKRIKIFSRGQAGKDSLTASATALGLTTEVAATAQDAIQDVDIVVTSVPHTSGLAPFLDAGTLRAGAFLTSVDLSVPWHRETYAALDRIAVDDLVQEAAMPTKLCDPALLTGDLSGLVLGKYPGRASESERTGFVFRGHALGDLGLSALVWERHLARQE